MIAGRCTVSAGGVLLRTVLGIVVQQLTGKGSAAGGSIAAFHLAAGIHQPQVVHLLGNGGTLSQNLLTKLLEGHLRLCLISGFQSNYAFQAGNAGFQPGNALGQGHNVGVVIIHTGSFQRRQFGLTFLLLRHKAVPGGFDTLQGTAVSIQRRDSRRSRGRGFRITLTLLFQGNHIVGLPVGNVGAVSLLHLGHGHGADILILANTLANFVGGVLYGAAQSLLQRLQAFA